MKSFLKRIFPLVILCAALSALALSASAETLSGSCGDQVTYTLDTDSGLLTISGTGAMRDYPNPYTPWYENQESIRRIIIENGVTTIGIDAFCMCEKLKSITIPNSVTSIAEEAFALCSDSKNITIPNSVTSIGEKAFAYCSSLKNITIPRSVTSIGSFAFYGCDSLTDITIPNKVTSIGEGTFYGCGSLTSIKIPSRVKSIDKWAFEKCSGLTSITIPDSVTSIGEAAFNDCDNIETVYYGGNSEQWNRIFIESDNDALEQAEIIYNAFGNSNIVVNTMAVTAVLFACGFAIYLLIRKKTKGQ